MEKLYEVANRIGGKAIVVFFMIKEEGTVGIDDLPGKYNCVGTELEEIIMDLEEYNLIEFLGDRKVRCKVNW